MAMTGQHTFQSRSLDIVSLTLFLTHHHLVLLLREVPRSSEAYSSPASPDPSPSMHSLSVLALASAALLTTSLAAPLASPKQFGGATSSVGAGAGAPKVAYQKVKAPAGGKADTQYYRG